MKNSIMKIHFIVFLFVAVFLVACKKSEPPTPPPQVHSSVKPLATVQKQASSAMISADTADRANFADVKDPFKPLIVVSQKAPVVKRNRFGQALPILNFEVQQFRVSGIIVGLKESSALLIDPDGKPYVVKTGMTIGRNEGKITKIAPGYLEVFEQYRDENGKLVKKTIRLTLPKKE